MVAGAFLMLEMKLKNQNRMSEIRFHIQYATRWGEQIALDFTTDCPDCSGRVILQTDDGCLWTGKLDLPSRVQCLTYAYCLLDSESCVARSEETRTRCFRPGRRSRVLLCDAWTERDVDASLLRSAFTECVYRWKEESPMCPDLLSSPYLLLVRMPPAPVGFRWGVSGSSATLGHWEEHNICFLQRTGTYEWGIELTSADFSSGMEYKYVLVSSDCPEKIVWESGENRCLVPHPLGGNEAAVKIDDVPRIALQPWRGAGVVMPVFSLRSQGSFGIGDFGDLRRFVVWAARTGLSVVQLLPINDTTASGTWRDSYPYSGISVFALHPIYLDLREWEHSAAYACRRERGNELNRLDCLDYESVFAEKMAFLHDLYGEIGRRVTASKDYKNFVQANTEWLLPYADFLRRKAQSQGRPVEPVAFFQFMQYLLHRQMSAAHEEARALGVILKGDIPIGICRDSVPAEVDTRLFHFDGQAGAPPDDFAVNGQNWGFPTYNWEEMARDGYAWWRKRFAHMKEYFDAYRIDHVLGFFRIWEIPTSQVHGVLGRFRPALPFSEDEIRRFGFGADIKRFTRPQVTAARFCEMEAEVGSGILPPFFDELPDGCRALKPEYSTQRQILAAVDDGICRQLLMEVAKEVLFLKDVEDENRYHPRVAARRTNIFGILTEADKTAFDRLHDDFFYVRHNEYWAGKALEKLSVIIDDASETAPMLPCAEDLGMVPASVKGVLERLDILSLEIQRMPKAYGVRFGCLKDNPYLSVSTIATHDMPPFRLWWREDAERTQAFWTEVLGREGQAPDEASPEICEEVVTLHLASSSMLCIIALQDLLGMDRNLRHPHPEEEQINDPANPDQYWQYRMHLTIEKLEAATSFNEKLRGLLARSGR